MNQWEQAWSEYISALDLGDAQIAGEDFPYWEAVSRRRLVSAIAKLREIDPEFCQQLGI